MSRSQMMMTITHSMLDGRVECNPEMADWSSGHTQFKSGHFRLGVRPPASWHFDELHADLREREANGERHRKGH